MTGQQVMDWLEGRGWIVLSGGNDALSDVRAVALSRMKSDGGVAYIGTHEAAADDLIEDMGELGAPTGYLVNVLMEDDDTIREMLEDAALVVIPDDLPTDELKSVLTGAPIEALKDTYERGAVILAEGRAARVLGGLFLTDNRGVQGLNWVRDTMIVPALEEAHEWPMVREVLAAHAVRAAVGIGVGSALALGPDGIVETWGERQVTVVLGTSRAT